MALRLSPADAMRVATLTRGTFRLFDPSIIILFFSSEIETLQTVNTPHSRAREQTLSDQRAQIFFDALAQQNANNLGNDSYFHRLSNLTYLITLIFTLHQSS